MKHSKLKKCLALCMSMLLILAMVPASVFALMDFTVPDGMFLVSQSERVIAPGVIENKIVTNKTDGQSQVMGYAVSVDMSEGSTATLKASYADYPYEKDVAPVWKMQTVRNQAAIMEKKTGLNVVAGVNADIFNMSTGEPTNSLVLNGKVCKAGLGTPYFAIMKDGSAKIGSSMTQDVLDNARESIGGFYVIVKDGKRTSYGNYTGNFAPKTAVGIKADGTVVIYVADGRNFPVSVGLNDVDLASIMLGLGCVDVINLDGGGSTTYAAEYEGSGSLEVANVPSDGAERKVSSALMVVSTAKPTGVFDHASVMPSSEVYSPGSEIAFTAIGVDSSGGKANLPEDGKFVLANASAAMGIITDEGVFTSNGTVGEVTVNYVSGGSVYGTTTVEVVHPDEIYFATEEISLGFGKESTLGLTVKYKDRDVNYKDGDILWTLSDPAMGSFNGNVFTSSDSETVNGTITATYVNDASVSGSIKAIIGRLPTVMMDFEDFVDEDGTVTKAKDYWTFANGVCNPSGGSIIRMDGSGKMLAATYDRGAVPTPEIIDIDSGEPVRFGNNSLKFGYDFTKVGNTTEGCCVGFVEQTQQIEGSPTGIGMWVYAPEGTPNLWLRIRVRDGKGTVQTVNFTESSGIDWSGWKYVEADLTQFTGPFSLIGGETIRIMVIFPSSSGTKAVDKINEDGSIVWRNVPRASCKGEIYIDNLQFVYGANTDDIDNPIVSSIMANSVELTDGATLDTNTVTFRATYTDVQNRYTTGVDPNTVRLYIDGVNVNDNANCVLVPGDETINLYDVELANGPHTVKMLIRDGFGNETVETRKFVINGDKDYTTVKLVPENSGKAVLNSEYKLNLVSDNISDVKSVNADIKIDKAFSDFTVEFADGFSGSYNYDSKNAVISIAAAVDGNDTNSDVIASVKFKIPVDLAEGKKFSYAIDNATYELVTDNGDAFASSFSCPITFVDVVAPFNVDVDTMIVGLSGNITVTDLDGNPVAGAQIYNYDTLIGTTGDDGVLSTDALCASVAEYEIKAIKDSEVSFISYGQSVNAALNSDGNPEYIMANAVKNADTSKNITWLSNPLATDDSAVVLLAKKADYDANGEAAFVSVDANSDFFEFLGSSNIANNYAIRINYVVIDGLEKNTEYVYKVGDGTVFSDVRSFSTPIKGMDTDFFIIGDAQASDMANINQILSNLENSGVDYDFGIQTGDSIESASLYSDWIDVLGIFGSDFLSNVDIVHVLGNHEFMGDPDGIAANTIYNIPSDDVYSVEYGNVYIATLTYTTSKTELTERMNWIVEDAAKSTAQWKVLTMHQPPYYTNIIGANDIINEIIPPLAEKAGIDFVFSGHDHSFARTEPIYQGEVDEDNGIVYYICGSTGEKAYGITVNPDFHFAVTDGDYDAVYTTVHATDKEFSVTTYDVDGSIIDSYTKQKNNDCTSGGHSYTYSEGYLECAECHYVRKLGTYTGFATDAATGRTMYFIGGVPQKGWYTNLNDCYYFDENGLAVTGKNTIDGIEYNFAEDGKQIGAAFVKDSDGVTRAYRGGALLKGWQEIDGYIYYFSRTDGAMRTGKTTVTLRTNQKLEVIFSEDGKLLRGAFYTTEDGTVYYWGSEPVSGWQEIEGKKYYFSPIDHYMATDNTEIDGQMYAFAMDGTFMHEGAHTWEKAITLVDPNCNVEGKDTYVCRECSTTKDVKVPALGHIDEDGNGRCDRCLRDMEHNSSFENFFYNIFNRILNFFKALFKSIFK
ncbi:MAG: phosphodiester glycosidase family protein [Acutalibacteraceae bacterium]